MSKIPLSFQPLRPYVWPLLLLLGANSLIISPTPPLIRYIAALVLLAFLPGWVWLKAFFGDQPRDETSPLLALSERLTLAVGLSLALTILGAMFAVYLPGSLAVPQLLIMIDALILAGLLTAWWQHRASASLLPCPPAPPPLVSPPPRLLSSPLLFLLLALLLAAALRLPHLGYAEFHEDEAEALMLGVRLMQGEDYAIFLHRKGPAQMLVPLAFWLLTGQITETTARFPFALSSIFSVATLFFIGRKWFNWQAGVATALLWAINGYAIAFGRMVQYQALIFFLGPLALYCLGEALKVRTLERWNVGTLERWNVGTLERWNVGRWLILGAILLATCLLAHFDALLLLPAAAYLGWMAVSGGAEEQRSRGAEERGSGGAGERGSKRKFFSALPPCPPAPLLIAAAIALTLFLALLASFYVPYLLDPEFKNTANYLAGSRVKPGLLYNNLGLLLRLDREYSSRFYLPLLVVGLIGFVLGPGIKRLFNVGSPRLKFGVEAKAVWLMFGAGFIGYVFLVDDPRTHLYIMYPGAVLLAGAGFTLHASRLTPYASRFTLHALRFTPHASRLTPHASRFTPLRLLGSFLLVILVGLVIVYEAMIFLPTESSLDGLRQRWGGSGWEAVYDNLPQAREYFGYPKREGWKAIGALRTQGLFPGDFRSVNEDFIIPIWYNYGQARSCYDTPAQFFVRAPGYDFYIPEQQIQNYGEVGWVQREEEVRLRVFSAGVATETTPSTYTLEALEPVFDQLATPQQFMQQAQPSRPVITQFGPAIQFLGFDLPNATVAPGETLYVNLYWRALQNPGTNYRAFVHLTDGTTLWSQQDDDPACRLPTSIWRAGQHGLGQFRLPIKPETPPGRYPLIIGLYRADTQERLKIIAGAGQVGDDFLWLGDVEVSKE